MNAIQVGVLKEMLQESTILSEWLENGGPKFMKQCRGRKGVREFAREIQVSPTLVSRIEHGKIKMGRPTLQKLLDLVS